MKMNQKMINHTSHRTAENARTQKGNRSGSRQRSWIGFYTHTAVPTLAMMNDLKQEQC